MQAETSQLSLFLSRSATYFYNIPDTKSPRKAGIGYGSKYDFTKGKKGGAPFYNHKDFIAAKTNRGWTFGESRKKFRKVYLENSKEPDGCSPGPGQYEFKMFFSKESKKYSMRAKTKDALTKDNTKSPGPGAYPLEKATPEGKRFNSKYKSVKGICWGQSKSRRKFIDSSSISREKHAWTQSLQVRRVIQHQR